MSGTVRVANSASRMCCGVFLSISFGCLFHQEGRAQELQIESRPLPLARGWSFRATAEGILYWFAQPLHKANAQEETNPFWFDLEEAVIYVYSNGDLGDAIFDLGVQLDIDLQALLAGEPKLTAAFSRTQAGVAAGRDQTGGLWTVAYNKSVAPTGFVEPYPGFDDELFGDADKDGEVTLRDLDQLGRAAAEVNLRIFLDAAQPAQRSSAMDLDILAIVAAYCPPECYPQLSNPDSNQTAALDCDPCFGDGGGGGGGGGGSTTCSQPTLDTCSQYGWSFGANLPPILHVNNDDDNGNGLADYTEGTVVGEDDLVSGSISIGWGPLFPGCTCATSSGYGVGVQGFYNHFAAYQEPNQTGGTWFLPYPPPGVVYLSGRFPTSSCGTPMHFAASCCRYPDELHLCTVQRDLVIVAAVTSLTWEKGHSSNAGLESCPNNGGLRIFPDHISSTDQPSPSDLRRRIKLVAQVTPPLQGRTVYFRVWDVDDPFDQLHGPNAANPADILPNVSVLDPDNPTGGRDNRGPEALILPWYKTATTDAAGKASVTFTVSMQPGNNYRAGASLLQDAINQATQATADALSVATINGKHLPRGSLTGYEVPLVWSPMLTVWRKLHVETDSMARPSFGQNTVSTTWNEPRFVLNQLVLDVPDQPYDNSENGYIRISAPGFPDLVSIIVTYTDSAGDDDVTTNLTAAQWGNRPEAGTCLFSDDDLGVESNFLGGIVGSDIGIGDPPSGYLPLPDLSGLENHYKPAYIKPVHEPEHTSLGAIPFVKNINDITEPAAWNAPLAVRALAVSVPSFWTTYVYSGFQAEQQEDYDGEITATKGISSHRENPFGYTLSYSSFGPAYTGMCCVFVESLRDGFGPTTHRITVAHEIAHTLGVDHGTDLMDRNVQTNAFSAASLLELRNYDGP